MRERIMTANRSNSTRRPLFAVALTASVLALGVAPALADDGAPPGCEDLAACVAQTDTAPDPTGVDASGDGTTIDSGTSDPAPTVDQPGGSTPVIIIVTTPVTPSLNPIETTTQSTPPTAPGTDGPVTIPQTPTVTATTAPVIPVTVVPDACTNLPGEKTMRPDWTLNPDGSCSAPPQHGLYCHVVDGVWKMEDLVRDQELFDGYWIIQGPWKDAYRDPVTGSASCDFPPDPAPAPQPSAPVTPLAASPPQVPPPQVFHQKTEQANHPVQGQVQLPPLNIPGASSTPKAAYAPAISRSPVAASRKQAAKKEIPEKMVELPPLPTAPPTG